MKKVKAMVSAIRTMHDAAVAYHGAESVIDQVVSFLQGKEVLPRSSRSDETEGDGAARYAKYLADFKPAEGPLADFRLALGTCMATARDQKLGERKLCRLTDGKVRRAKAGDDPAKCFTLSAVAAFTRSDESIAVLPGTRGDLTSERGLWRQERLTVQNNVSQKLKRLRSRCAEIIQSGSKGARASNKGIAEILAEAHGRAIKKCRSEGCAPWEEVQRVLKDAEQRVAALVDARKLDA